MSQLATGLKRSKRRGAKPLAQIAREAILTLSDGGMLPDGAVLLEGPIADRLGMSRAPVRSALISLAEEGLIRRFDGRGYILGGSNPATQPVRVDLRSVEWPTVEQFGTARQQLVAYRAIADEIEPQISALISFGCYRVSETNLADEFAVSRTVARDALFHLQQRGIVEKDRWSHWIAGPITAEMTRDQYGIRAALEPAALKQAASGLDLHLLDAAIERTRHALRNPLSVTDVQFDRLEADLHLTCLAPSKNRLLLATIKQNSLPEAANRLFFRSLPGHGTEAMLRQHLTVFEALKEGDIASAAHALEIHLQSAAERTVDRLKILSILPNPELPVFLKPFQTA